MSNFPEKLASKSEADPYQLWQMEIQASEKELEKWRRTARRIVKQFRAEKTDVSGTDVNFERRFNIFTANTQIMQAALLNQVPMPSVDREFSDPDDDVGRVACMIVERALMYQAKKDTRLFDILSNVVQDNLVPGVGLSWHTYKAEIESRTEEPTEEQLQLDPNAKPVDYDEVVGEELLDEYVYWEDLLWSPARTWDEVRWIARKVYMTRDQLIERFGEEVGKAVSLDYSPKKSESSVDTRNLVFQQACVYEIWNKEDETVYWWSKGYERILDKKEDFLELEGFFPCPRPLFATLSNGQLIPIPDYEYARDQYRELNEINTRISLLVRACRVAGVYDKSAGAIQQVLNNAAENVLVPVDQWAAFAERGGLKGAVDWIPLEQIVKTIDQLLKAREDVKAQIYEVTGMSDIIRGASKASETLGAQKIKAQYASMRIQTRQKHVALYASQVFAIQAQLMRVHMDTEEIARMAQVQFMGEDQNLVQQAMQLLKSEDFSLRVQVESDTLSDIDFQAERESRMEYMQAISLFLKENGPTMMNDPILGPFYAQLLQFSLMGFKIGKKFEGKLDQTLMKLQQKLANPQPPQPTPEQEKMKLEQQKFQQDSQLKQQDAQMNQQMKAADLQFKQQENQLKLVSKQQEAAINAQQAQREMAQNNAEFQQRMRQQMMENMMQPQLPNGA